MNKKQLENLFQNKDDKFWGVEIDKDNYSFFTDTNLSGVCSQGFAEKVKAMLGDKAGIFGFASTNNPTAGVNKLTDFHVFATVGGRYLVDPWLCDIENGIIGDINLNNQIVFDIVDDYDLIKKIYGDADCWRIL